jgi:hypothetical protein
MVLIALAIAAPACSTAIPQDVATTTPADVRKVDPKHVAGPFVQAGTVFTIELEQPIDTRGSRIGQPFTARTVEALVASNGRVIVPAGALVHGRVASTGNLAHPRVRLELDSIDTANGPASVAAVVLQAQRFTYPGDVSLDPVEAPAFADEYVYPFDPMGYGTGTSRGPSASVAYEHAYPREIRIPRGARISLELTRPILPPGTGFTP